MTDAERFDRISLSRYIQQEREQGRELTPEIIERAKQLGVPTGTSMLDNLTRIRPVPRCIVCRRRDPERPHTDICDECKARNAEWDAA